MRARAAIASGALILVMGSVSSAAGDTLTVGPGGMHAAPCAAFSAAADGDVIEIAAGDYPGDVCAVTPSGLTIRGMGGLAHIDAAGNDAQGKAIWVVQGDDTTIENIEFSGASVPDQNGAGIRQEGSNLTVRGCYFHDNENGILAGDGANSQILIEYSRFEHNGFGDGFSHNLYINHVARLVFQYNWSHRAVIGHLLKSRAAETHVLYNRLTGESDGTESYEIDLPNGGKTYVIGNLIEQGPQSDNSSLLGYMQEGQSAANPSDALFVVNNTFVNDLGSGTFVNVGASVGTPVVIRNNVFWGGGTITNQPSALLENNHSGPEECLVDAANFDYRMVDGSPCVDGGTDPGSDGGFSLVPGFHYLHPTANEARSSVGTIDIGAYELGGGEPVGASGAGGAAAEGGADSSSAGAPSASGGTPNPGGGAPNPSAGTTSASAGTSASPRGGAPAAEPSDAKDDGGCGCRAARRSSAFGLPLAALLVLGVRRARARALGAENRRRKPSCSER